MPALVGTCWGDNVWGADVWGANVWASSGTAPVVAPRKGAGGLARDKRRRKFVIDGQVFNGTEEDAKRALYAVLDTNKPDVVEAPKKSRRRSKRAPVRIEVTSVPFEIDQTKYQVLLADARAKDDVFLSQMLYEVWRESMQAREDDDEEVLLWLM